MVVRKMIRSLIRLLTAFFLVLAAALSSGVALAASGEGATADALARGQAQLEKGELENALTTFKQIQFSDPRWTLKLESLIRYHLSQKEGSPEQAWRLVQLGKRTSLAPASWRDYERLALFKSGACPLSLGAFDRDRGFLLSAATARFHDSILKDSSTQVRGASALVAGLVPYLNDLPSTQLVAGQGCRFVKAQLTTEQAAMKSELEDLLSYLRSETAARGPRLPLILRADELAKTLGRQDDVTSLAAMYPAASDVKWSELPDEERRWVFARLFPGKKIEDVALEKRAAAQAIAVERLSHESEEGSVTWLAMIDLSAVPARNRVTLLRSADQRAQSSPQRGWILLQLAHASVQLNEMNDALTVLRRLLREKEAALDESGELEAVDLASDLFSTFRRDPKMYQAMRTALPVRLWGHMIDQTILNFALTGQAREFSQLVSKREAGTHDWRESDLELLKPIADRRPEAFRKILERRKFADAGLLKIAAELVTYRLKSIEASDSLKTYASAMSGWLAKYGEAAATSDSDRTAQIHDLALALNASGGRLSVEGKVRSGLIEAGDREVVEATGASGTDAF